MTTLEGKRAILIFSWPSPWAIRVLLSEWKFRRRDGWECRILDFSNTVNRFAKHHGLVVASRFHLLKKHLLIIQALRIWCFLFYFDFFRTWFENNRGLSRSDDVTMHQYCNSQIDLYFQGALKSLKSLYPKDLEEDEHVGRIELESLERTILARVSQFTLRNSCWIMFSGRFPIDLLFWRISSCFRVNPLFVETGRGPRTRVISTNLFSELGYREIVESEWARRPDDWKILVDQYLELRKRGSTPSQVFWGQSNYSSFSVSKERKICAFFLSTTEEFLPHVSESETLPFKDQNRALIWAMEQCKAHNLLLVVRDHPGRGHEDNIDGSLRHQIDTSMQGDVIFINKDDSTSSLAVIEQSDYCITFGSSVGIDVVIQEKPLLCLGPNVLVSQKTAKRQRDMYHYFFRSPELFIHHIDQIEQYVYFESRGGLPLNLNEDWFH